MKQLVCLLEEPSAKQMLQGVLPRILPEEVSVHYMVFEGKQDMEKNISRRIKLWMHPGENQFLVLRDQDSGECIAIKENLREKIIQTGKNSQSLIRIACKELESFYLGDLNAVAQALKAPGLEKLQNTRKFRDPDLLGNAAEELKKVTKNQYEKVAGSRAIAPLMILDGTNCSTSFNMLVTGIKKLCSDF